MSLTPHNDDSRREGQDVTTTRNLAVSTPAVQTSSVTREKPVMGRPLGSVKKGSTGLRGKCWWLMRELNTFTINRLLETYADGTEKNAHNNITNYLSHLAAYGVVERLDRRQPGDSLTSPGFVVWRLKRNLGILAPVWRSGYNVLWDPNRWEAVVPGVVEAQQQDSQVNSEPDSND